MRMPPSYTLRKSADFRMRALFGKVWLVGVPDGSLVAHGKLVAALGAAARENGAAVFTLHARPESVCLRPLAIVWLKCTLWHVLARCGPAINSMRYPKFLVYG